MPKKKEKNKLKNLLFFFKSKKPKFWHFFEVPPFQKKIMKNILKTPVEFQN